MSKSIHTIILILAALLGASSRAADASRFLRVTNWVASFTHTLSLNGDLTYIDPSTEDVCDANWSFQHAITENVQLGLDPSSATIPTFRRFLWTKTDSESVSYNDTFRKTCDGASYSHTANDIGVGPTYFFLTIDTAANQYGLTFPPQRTIPGKSEIKFDDFTSPGNIGIGWAPSQLYTNALPASGEILQGELSFPMSEVYLAISEVGSEFLPGDPRFGGMHPLKPTLLTGNVRITWLLKPQIAELELVVEPQGYASWRPEAARDEDTAGNTIPVKVTLKNSDGSAPSVKAEKIIFELIETSREPGVDMNFPLKAGAKTSHDLQFSQGNNPAGLIIQNNGQNAQTPSGQYTTYTVTLSSFDWGGWTKIRATAVMPGGENVVGHLVNDKAVKDVPIPKRKDDSHIAEAWLTDSGATGSDSGDEENDPPGDGNNGDGLTLYEEYRGFHENGRHIAGDPKKKDYFLLNLIGADAEPGVWLFAELSGLEVHKDLQRDELADDRLINANTDQGAHAVAQHGVIMKTANISGASAYSSAGLPPGPPKNTEVILIEPRDSPFGEFGVAASKIFRLSNVDTLQVYDRAVAHELLHTVGVWHHGEGDYKAIWRWHSGSVSPTGKPFFVSLAQKDGVIVPGGAETPIKVTVEETGRDYADVMEERMAIAFEVSPNLFPSRTVLMDAVIVGKPGGEHSGADDCVMRYHFATVYEAQGRPNEFYIFEHQTIGLELDDSPDGTGNNAPDHKPQPRFFGASVTRGDHHQIVVNDKANPTKP